MHRRLPDADHRDEYANRWLSQGRRDIVVLTRQEFSHQGYTSEFPGHNFRSRPLQNLGFLFPWLQILAMSYATCVALAECSALRRFLFISKMSTYFILWILWAFALAFDCNTLSSLATCLILLAPSPPPSSPLLKCQLLSRAVLIIPFTAVPLAVAARLSVRLSFLPSGESRAADKCSRSWGPGDRKWEMAASCSALPAVLWAHNVGHPEGLFWEATSGLGWRSESTAIHSLLPLPVAEASPLPQLLLEVMCRTVVLFKCLQFLPLKF